MLIRKAVTGPSNKHKDKRKKKKFINEQEGSCVSGFDIIFDFPGHLRSKLLLHF